MQINASMTASLCDFSASNEFYGALLYILIAYYFIHRTVA